MKDIESGMSMDGTDEQRVQPLSEREAAEVSGGAGGGKPSIVLKMTGAPGASAGASAGRQNYFK